MKKALHPLYTNRDRESVEKYIARLLSLYSQLPEEFIVLLYRLNNEYKITRIFEEIDFSKLMFREVILETSEILKIDGLFPDWIERVSKSPEEKIFRYKKEIIEEWKNNGTWLVPIMVFKPKEKSSTKLKDRVIFEGNTRVGILKGLLTQSSSIYKTSSYHRVLDVIEM